MEVDQMKMMMMMMMMMVMIMMMMMEVHFTLQRTYCYLAGLDLVNP